MRTKMADGNPKVFDLTIHSRKDGKYVVTPGNNHGKDYLNSWEEFDHTVGNAIVTKDDLSVIYKSCMRIKWSRNGEVWNERWKT